VTCQIQPAHCRPDRTLLATLASLEQQAREYEHCLAAGDAPGMLRAGIQIQNAASFLFQEAIDEEAAHARRQTGGAA
jgi:hypothetical protein